ncbi:MAG: DNA circularization N-terminal domain-containing protein, partial [Mariprofundaceae bacterium]|nr:DNA circularization N-terminal domain-containing protein [Mariprofundaceae bacterium]
MTWRDQMQKGSFRGVPFRCRSQDTEGGRRVARHEYPGRDTPWAEDLGRKARTHSLEMILVGPDYMAGRDAMLAALDKPGSAELIHPWLGRLQVQVETYRLRESTREGGMAMFTVTFTEAGQQQFPAASADTASAVDVAAGAAVAAASADFEDTFSVDGQPGWVLQDAVNVMQSATRAIEQAVSMLPGVPDRLTSFYGDLTRLQGSLNTMVLNPANTASGITGILSGIADLFADPLPALQAYQSLTLFGDNMNTPPSTTPARQAQAANQQACVDLIQRVAVIEAARTSSRITPESSAIATSMRDDLASRLDSEAETASDAVCVAL